MNAGPLPEWLRPHAVLPPQVRRAKDLLYYQEPLYDSVFMSFMERLASGIPLQTIIENDPREIDYGLFMRWIMQSKKRKAEYYECLAVCAEIMFSEIVQIADADGSLEDTQRSSLRIETRKYFMKTSNKGRFADTKTLDINTKAITDDDLKKIPTEELMQMMIDGEFDEPIDITMKEIDG